MIKRFNRKQYAYGSTRALVSLVLFVVTYYFFKFITGFFIDQFSITAAASTDSTIAAVCVAIIAISGFIRWRNGQGHFSIEESLISSQLDPSTGSAWATQNYVNRVTGPSFYLATLFLAAPLQMLQAYDHFQSIIPIEPDLENRMLQLLDEMQSDNKWQNFNTYTGWERELIFLIKMGKVEYSAQKGRVKAAA